MTSGVPFEIVILFPELGANDTIVIVGRLSTTIACDDCWDV